MDRKQFLRNTFQAGVCACYAAIGFGQEKTGPAAQDWIPDLEKRLVKGAETPPWNRYEKAQEWIKNLMANMDTLMDPAARLKLLQACGRSCYLGAFGVASEEKPSPEAVQQFLNALRATHDVRQEGNSTIITYNWGRNHQNPFGIMIQDGYCMCPVVETGPPGLSPTFCLCSPAT